MASSMFDDGANVVQRELMVKQNSNRYLSLLDDFEYDQVFEIRSTITYVKRYGYKRVALQLPDELLSQSWRIVQRLKCAIGRKIYNYFYLKAKIWMWFYFP